MPGKCPERTDLRTRARKDTLLWFLYLGLWLVSLDVIFCEEVVNLVTYHSTFSCSANLSVQILPSFMKEFQSARHGAPGYHVHILRGEFITFSDLMKTTLTTTGWLETPRSTVSWKRERWDEKEFHCKYSTFGSGFVDDVAGLRSFLTEQ